MAREAIAAIRDHVAASYGGHYLPSAPREYQTKVKNAQEAHEAIRPTDVARTPDSVARFLSNDQRRLYELIWKRAVASQMQSAELDLDGRSFEAERLLTAPIPPCDRSVRDRARV